MIFNSLGDVNDDLHPGIDIMANHANTFVVVYDLDGHTAGKSLLVNVHNSAGPLNLGGGVPNDIYIRDSDTDVGAVPSNLGGQPFWNSPDILVVSSGAGPDTSKRTDQVMEGKAYDVWVQVHYPVCNGLSGVKVKLASANPSTFIDSSKWKSITKTGFEVPQGSPADGVPLLPNSTDQWIGPFSWTPGSDEIGTDGHRCLLDLDVFGASDTIEFACFDGLVENVVFRSCSVPLRITVLPKGASSLQTEASCTVSDISGAAGVPYVDIEDASLVTDFSSLTGTPDVTIAGDVSLDLIAPYVLDASMLVLRVNATSLAPLDNAKADHLWIEANGLHSLADYMPLPSLTCFSMWMDPTATTDERSTIASLCTATRSGPQCPDYNCLTACWVGVPPCEGS